MKRFAIIRIKNFALGIIIILLISCLMGCNTEDAPQQSIENHTELENPDESSYSLDNCQGINYSKTFVDAEDLQSEILQYEYRGGTALIAVRIDNGDRQWTSGITIDIDGVFQQFSIVSANGSFSDTAYMPLIDIPSNESVVVQMSFEPILVNPAKS